MSETHATLGEVVEAARMGKRMDRAIRGKLSREIHRGRPVAMSILGQWARERYPEEFDDDATARRFVEEIARDWMARARYRPSGAPPRRATDIQEEA